MSLKVERVIVRLGTVNATVAESYTDECKSYSESAATSAQEALSYAGSAQVHSSQSSVSASSAAQDALSCSEAVASAEESATIATEKAELASGYADEASVSAQLAVDKALEAATSASGTESSVSTVTSYKDICLQKAGEASTAADTVLSKVSEANASAASAVESQNAAGESAETASAKSAEAVISAAAAATKAGEASTSASSAAASAQTATIKASEVALREDTASANAVIATGRATEAANSASAAASSATDSFNSAASASQSAAAALVSSNNADAKSASAAASAVTATTKASEAAASATSMNTSVGTCTEKALAAATSATSAASSAVLATNKVTEINNLGTVPATMAAAAATSATAAASSASQAAASAALASNPAWIKTGASPIYLDPTFQWRPGREDVPSIVTATRASTAFRTNEVGLIEQVAADAVRIDHDPITGECLGALCEEARTNLLTYSENFDNAAWTKTRASITPNAAVAPDGTMTADKLMEDTTATSSHVIGQSLSVSAGSTVTFQCRIKAAGRTWCKLILTDSGNKEAYFNLSTGSVGTTVSGVTTTVKQLLDGWWLLSITYTIAGTSTVAYLSGVTADNTPTHTGDGTSGLYIWGAQLEAGAFPTSYVPSSVTFTSRASTATYVGSDGLIKSAAIDTARMNYNPTNLIVAPKLLVEAASTNLLTYSEDFSNAAWIKFASSINSNAAISPDGSLTADKLVESAATSSFNVNQGYAGSRSVAYTASCRIKKGERSIVRMQIFGGAGNSVYAFFDVLSGSFSSVTNGGTGTLATASIKDIGGGYYLCSLSGIPDSSGTGVTLQINLVSSGTTVSYTGDGTSGLYIWGAQLESGTLSSYIPTTTAAVTRAADVSSSAAATRAADVWTVPVSSFAFNKDEGTVYVGSSVLADSGTRRIANLTDGTANNRMTFYLTTSAQLDMYCAVGGVSQVSSTSSAGVVTKGTQFKSCFSYKQNNFGMTINGASLSGDTTCLIPSGLTTLEIGAYAAYPQFLNGHIRHIAYFPRRISDSNLQLLTA